jgi:hypothetical protein
MTRTLGQSPGRSLIQSLSLVVRYVVFTVVVPGLGGAWLPWWLLTHGHGIPAPAAWEGGGPGHRGRRGVVLYLAALLVVLGEAWLFTSPRLLAYAAAMAACFHLFVTGYEERTLARRFGPAYLEYRRAVPRWLPRKRAYPAGGGTTGAGNSRV